jgi:hypothetical protein
MKISAAHYTYDKMINQTNPFKMQKINLLLCRLASYDQRIDLANFMQKYRTPARQAKDQLILCRKFASISLLFTVC